MLKRFLAGFAVAVMLAGGSVSGYAEDEFTATKDCSVIAYDGTGWVRYTDKMHEAEYIPDEDVIHVDAGTIKYDGTTYWLFESEKKAEIIEKCG